MAVPLFDPQTPQRPLRAELRAAVHAVLDGGAFVLGPEVEAFEREFAAYLGTGYAVGVANGTEAITIALRALGVGPGDDVVVPSFTFWASAEAIPPTGARPVFCDVDDETMLATAGTVRAVLTPNTKAVVVPHLFGNVADIAAIEALGVPVVEDTAQAAGSIGPGGIRPGAMGSISTFSFYPSKNLGAFGDGGAICTRDAELDERVRTLRFHGSRDKVDYETVGYNSRLDELQAAILRVQLPQLDNWARHRYEAGLRYADAIAGLVRAPQAAPDSIPAWHLYMIRHARADDILSGLTDRGVGARPYYRTPIHAQAPMLEYAPADPAATLPVTVQAAREHLAIPMSAAISVEQQEEVVRGLEEACAALA
jgi:dTDP-4-amino-4,6-dideoxygalactose transaminase